MLKNQPLTNTLRPERGFYSPCSFLPTVVVLLCRKCSIWGSPSGLYSDRRRWVLKIASTPIAVLSHVNSDRLSLSLSHQNYQILHFLWLSLSMSVYSHKTNAHVTMASFWFKKRKKKIKKGATSAMSKLSSNFMFEYHFRRYYWWTILQDGWRTDCHNTKDLAPWTILQDLETSFGT